MLSNYVEVYKSGEREILLDAGKLRVYARFYGFMSEGMFRNGQAALDATFAILAGLKSPHIDYILDIRYGKPFSDKVFELWKEKALELLPKYAQLYTVGVADETSALFTQISQWEQLFTVFEDRIGGIFKLPEEAEAFLDKLRGYGPNRL
jgi:hypothetical protein